MKVVAALLLTWMAPGSVAAQASDQAPSGQLAGVWQPTTAAEIERCLTSFAAFGAPCRYRLTATELYVAVSDPLFEAPETVRLRELATRAPEEAIAATHAGALATFASLCARIEVPEAPPGHFVRQYAAREVSTLDVQLEELIEADGYGNRATLRTPGFNLLYTIQQPVIGDQLVVAEPSAANLLNDMRMLLTPLRVDPFILDQWREHAWSTLRESASEFARHRLSSPAEPGTDLQLVVSAASALPAAAWLRAGDEVAFLGLYSHAPLHAQSAQLWLRSGLLITWQPHALCVQRYEISDVDFDVSDDAMRMRVRPGTVYIDQRTADGAAHADPRNWPADVRSWIRFDRERYRIRASDVFAEAPVVPHGESPLGDADAPDPAPREPDAESHGAAASGAAPTGDGVARRHGFPLLRVVGFLMALVGGLGWAWTRSTRSVA